MNNASLLVLFVSIACLLMALANGFEATYLGMKKLDHERAESSATVTTVESRTVSVPINRPFRAVYEFLAAPDNWNGWARGLGKSIRHAQDGWIADTQSGTVKVQFSPKNNFGIVDYCITRKSGVEIYVPMRITVNRTGSEVLVTLFREADMSDEKYAASLESVKQDLNALKELLEK